HPVVKVIVSFSIIVFIIYKIVSKIYASPKELSKSPNTIASVLFILLFTGVFFLGLRGSYGPFPLQIDDSTVSKNQFINSLTLNGLFTLEKAIEERNEASKPIYQRDVLTNSGYQSINQVMADYYCLPMDSFPSANYLDYLFETTATDSFLAKNPPNVVFVLMESFGGYYLNFHSSKLNLLGSLEKHIHEDFLFTNFLSSTQGTIYSLENILINKDYPLISSSNRRFESFQSSIAYPYSNAGYQTIFITGGKLGWRNLVDFLPHQYFKEAYGEETIVKNNPNAITNTWGVYDEYLFEEIFNRLASHPTSPQLICALTTSNHTPYELPDHYQPYSIEISDSLRNQLLANKDIAKQNFTAYQYANDCLGNFLTKLKASKYGANTIVAVSGDHNSYALFPHNNGKIKEQDNHIVPFFLFIPENYKKGLHINKNRYGSHKDIFPTLINLSLSNSTYFSLGNNLLDVSKPDSLFYGINGDFYFGDASLSRSTLDKMVKARSVLNTYYFALP
ncbi:MAG: phosphatidylglycerol--membrane-oligosaccharide glycerophosphotransferase, partial [Flavobacteriales bacterium CG_4_9_14_3_um_filter_32_8]